MDDIERLEDIQLYTKRCTISASTTADSARLFQVLESNRLPLLFSLSWVAEIRTENDLCHYLQKFQEAYRDRQGVCFKIKIGQDIAGLITLADVELAHRRARLSCWLSVETMGQGLMQEAAFAVIEFAFEKWNLHRLEYRCSMRNQRALRFGRRIGFQLEGILSQAESISGQYVDQAIFGTVRSKWNTGKPLPAEERSKQLLPQLALLACSPKTPQTQ